MKHIPLFTLAALALVPAVHAQSLRLGNDAVVTVDGTGTHGTISSTTTSYTDSSTIPYAVQTNGTATFTLGTGGTLTASGTNTGLQAYGSGAITITGGSIMVGSNGTGLYTGGSSPITITGGSITAGSGGYGLAAGTSNSSIDLYGMFSGTFGTLTPGQTQTFTNDRSGSFTGTLENNTTSQIFTYYNLGTITLHDVALAAAPEPSQFAAFAVGLLGLGILAVKAKRRTT